MKLKNKIPVSVRNYIQVFLGCVVFAAGIGLFLAPNNLAPGGCSGIAIIISHFIDIMPVGTWVIVINVPIILLGLWKLGFKFLIPTLIAIPLSSVAINLFSQYIGQVTKNDLLACVAGGVLVATGIGLVFRGGATTGGTDIIVKVLRTKFKHMSTGSAFLFVDGAICVTSGIVFQNVEKALFAGIALCVQMFVLNTVLYGSDEARMVYIISKNDDIIAERLLHDLDVGATYLYAKGAYTDKDKKVLMCVMRMRTLPQARALVRKIDEDAFMIVTKATSVFGEGFKSHSEEDL